MPDTPLLLASASVIRLQLLQKAGINVTVISAAIDEHAVRASLTAEGASPRDIADTLAELKAAKGAARYPAALVLGCDQILACDAEIFSKPVTPDNARFQLQTLRGQTHQLHTAIVLYHQSEPIWRHLATAQMTMRPFSDAYLEAYLERNWPTIQHSVGGYLLESEGIRLFSATEGDYFGILGLPLLPLLTYLTLRGFVTS
jgi:septum formation protein